MLSFCVFLLLPKIIRVIFVATFKIPENMFEFSQYLGFLLFLTILTMGFWLMFFLVGFVSYWVGGASWEAYKEKKAKKKQEQSV
ncbi:hypothetical protein FVB9288_01745 [Flavobacterium sp. CECT 9288]|jgi:hypothetical protein|nr:hypothetical protein FPG59_06460 [Flavobacterium sp. FPG59]CAH0336072.1 hypothetical protein FVB9288_01745 [Flavobacterium sp. CECT 9288]